MQYMILVQCRDGISKFFFDIKDFVDIGNDILYLGQLGTPATLHWQPRALQWIHPPMDSVLDPLG
jgi:hypothetical protein